MRRPDYYYCIALLILLLLAGCSPSSVPDYLRIVNQTTMEIKAIKIDGEDIGMSMPAGGIN